MSTGASLLDTSPPTQNDTILQTVQKLLGRLAAPKDKPDMPLAPPTTLQSLRLLESLCGEIQTGADKLVSEYGRKRNHFLLVHQLPPAILSEIWHLALSEGDYSWRKQEKTYLHRQKELRLVCGTWNEAIKTIPSLWSTVSCGDVHERRLETALRMSKDTPLDITCCATATSAVDNRCRRFSDEMAGVVQRWRSLNVGPNFRADPAIQSAPKLHSIICHGKRESNSIDFYPRSLLIASALQLHQLRLNHVVTSWNWPKLPLLKDLYLRSIPQGPTVSEFLTIISQAPQLEDLVVFQVGIQPFPDQAWFPNIGPIERPCLRTMAFNSVRLDSLTQILNSLQASKGCKTTVVANNHDTSFRPFLEYICRRIPEVEHKDRPGSTSVEVDLYQSSEMVLEFPKHNSDLSFMLIDSRWQEARAQWQACRQMLEAVRTAFRYVNGDPGVNLWTFYRSINHSLRRIHAVYPNLAHLCTITDEDTLSMLSRAQAPILEGEGVIDYSAIETREEWLFPKLEYLHLTGSPDITGIVELMEARLSNDAVRPIKSLVVANADNVREEVRARLKELVSYVEFRSQNQYFLT